MAKDAQGKHKTLLIFSLFAVAEFTATVLIFKKY